MPQSDIGTQLKRNKKFILFIGLAIIGLLYISNGMSIIPPFEGLNMGVNGFEDLAGVYTRVDNAPTLPYWWISDDPHNTILAKQNQYIINPAGVRIEIGSPRILYEWWSQPRTVDYWLDQDGEYIHVSGQVNIYTVPITISAANYGALTDLFNGEKIWIDLACVPFNRALQEQSPISGKPSYLGTAWEAPLAVYITSYAIDQGGDHGSIEPAYEGRFITLYSSPASEGTIADLLSGDINATFVGDLSPDTRLSQSAFMQITLSDFGLTPMWWGIGGVLAPVVDYDLKIYTLQIGKYTYTNIDDTPWGQRVPEGWDPWGDFLDWLANPWNTAMLGTFAWAIIIGVVLILILVFFGPSVITRWFKKT